MNKLEALKCEVVVVPIGVIKSDTLPIPKNRGLPYIAKQIAKCANSCVISKNSFCIDSQ